MSQRSKFFPLLWTNRITLTGSVLTTVTGVSLVIAVLLAIILPFQPYLTAMLFLILPVVFVFGLLLIPVGLWWEGRKEKKGKALPPDRLREALKGAWEDRSSRHRLFWVASATVLNILIVAGTGAKVVSFMDSPEFCGKTCHTVMQPEYEAFLNSPHSRVSCSKCHIGPGASWAVKSKLDGLRQVWAVTFNRYDRPIPSPVHTLRPARDTCEQCHWPAKFTGSRLVIRSHTQADEKNSPSVNALLLHVGGSDPKTGAYRGIHWHVSPDVQIRYQALDLKRENIGRITRLDKGQVSAVFERGEATGPVKEERLMDCVDCHNRPSHRFDASAEAALDRAFSEGNLDAAVPFLAAVARKVLTDNDLDRDSAEGHFTEKLKKVYAQEHPESQPNEEQLHQAAVGLAALYRANIYPSMKIGWGTYPTHLGHAGDEKDLRGCFRCHDEQHKTPAGATISQDCGLCHDILAQEENPEALPEALKALLPKPGL